MAALTATYVGTLDANTRGPNAFGDAGAIIEVWSTSAAAADADTVTITPRFMSDIRWAWSSYGAKINITGQESTANATVVFTLSLGTTTGANGQYFIVGRR